MQPYVLRVLEAFGDGVIQKSNGWLAKCPVPTHGSDGKDSNPSVRISIGEQGRIIVACRVGCPTEVVLHSVGLAFKDLYPPAGAQAEVAIASFGTPKEEDYSLRAAVHSALLAELELIHAHRQSLRARGFTDAEIDRNGYRSLTAYSRIPVARKLYERFGEDLFLIPGFERTSQGGPSIWASLAGMVIPLRNVAGQVVALKTRLFFGSVKYLLWSSKDASGRNHYHCPLHDHEAAHDCVRITEGELKADLAYARTGVLTISSPGVGPWREVLPALAQLTPKECILSFDWQDVCTKVGVAHSEEEMATHLLDIGHRIAVEHWPAGPKGIDDALVAGTAVHTAWDKDAIILIRSKLSALLAPADLEKEEQEGRDWKDMPFPLDVFPKDVRAFIEQTAQVLHCPPDYCAAGVLAAAARAIGGTRAVKLEGGWSEKSLLWLCIIAPSSSSKSPSIKRALRPLKRLQKQAVDKFRTERRNYRQALSEAKTTKEGANCAPPKPLWHVWSADITREALASRLANNVEDHERHEPGLLIHRDEILGWVRSFNAYRGRGDDKEFYLSLASGEDLKVDRKTNEETIVVEEPACSILGGIQPDLLNQIQPEGNAEDGFLPRFLFLFPTPPTAYRPSDERYDSSLDKQWNKIIRRLFCLQPKNEQPKYLKLTPAAFAAWFAWNNQIADQREAPSFDNRLGAMYGKLRQHGARLLLVLHYLRLATNDPTLESPSRVDVETVNRMIRLIAYFVESYKRVVWTFPLGPQERMVRDFCQWVRLEHRGKVSLRQIYRTKKFSTLGRRDALDLCRLAEDRGFGTLSTEKDARQRERQIFTLAAPSEDS